MAKIIESEVTEDGNEIEISMKLKLSYNEIPDELYWQIYDDVIDRIYIYFEDNNISITSGDSGQWRDINFRSHLINALNPSRYDDSKVRREKIKKQFQDCIDVINLIDDAYKKGRHHATNQNTVRGVQERNGQDMAE